MGGLYTQLRKTNPRIWRIWYRMCKRCNIPQKNYENVEVDPNWDYYEVGSEGFIRFYDDMIATYRDDLELDRIDPYGNYNKDNTRWATRTVNNNNTRWHKSDLAKRWNKAKELGINRHTVYGRLERGWDIDEAFTLPPNRLRRYGRKK